MKRVLPMDLVLFVVLLWNSSVVTSGREADGLGTSTGRWERIVRPVSISYLWNFGDGGTSTSRVASHTYSSPATYVWWLTVTDRSGCTCTRSGRIVIANQSVRDLTSNVTACPDPLTTGTMVSIEL